MHTITFKLCCLIVIHATLVNSGKQPSGETCERKNHPFWRHRLQTLGQYLEQTLEKSLTLNQVYSVAHGMKAKLIATKPLIFEIDDFLDESESAYLIKKAQDIGLDESKTIPNVQMRGNVRLMDLNQDKKLSMDEMMLTLEDSFDLYFTEDDVKTMYGELKIDPNDDNVIEQDELQILKPAEFSEHLQDLAQKLPRIRGRFSKHAWIKADKEHSKTLDGIMQRVQDLTRLPKALIQKSDFQVVSYKEGGHYNGHYDSAKRIKQAPCCTRLDVTERCLVCRYMTIMFYLNDVEEGGQTAFPVANSETFDEDDFRLYHGQNLVRNQCSNSTLLIEPKRGKAVLWYNHEIDPETDWVGEMDSYSVHGGCPVTKGDKWIGNIWIKFTPDPMVDLTPTIVL